ncbi:MAG: cold shock domain-containing protein [Legionellales bacterium]|nr:cold shock domain-containing protein [Legionellales bacterium]
MSLKNIIQSIQRLFQGKGSSAQCSGIIKFFDRKKRFGFIVAGKHEYFFHAAAASPSDFKALQDGVAVKFNIVQGKKGPQADNIEIVA